MSCQFNAVAKIVDLEKVKTCLFVSENDYNEDFEDESWNWSVDEKPSTTTVHKNWLEDCRISLSPTSELLALAHEKNLVILKAKWDSSEESEAKIKYLISWHGDPCLEHSEKITSILCLPIAAQGKLSAHCGADWTCIAVGYSSGAVRFYTEKGSMLLSEVLHDEPVCQLKCQSYQMVYNSCLPSQGDELYVIYPAVVCCIQGFVLCNTLKACRNQLARVEAHCGDRIDAPPLALTKWSLSEQDFVNDICVIGSQETPSLCHLITASVKGGYYAMYRSTPPKISTVVAAGVSPFVGFHCIMEGAANPILTDVAKAVATKVKSAIGQVVPGWLGGGRRPSSVEKAKEKGALEPAESMSCRFGICDIIRKGERLYLSPEKSFSVACDTLGRVILIDNLSGIALRMWKGYRDAQCAFIPVEEKKLPGSGKRALYLVIYAPKKGIIEVWALQHGPKLSTFLAPKNGRLLYINYGLLGVNALSMKTSNTSQHPCVFLNPDGIISQVIVPFHSILSKSDPKSRDEHILKQVKRALSNCNGPEFLQLTAQLTTSRARVQAFETAAKAKFITPELLEQAITGFVESLNSIDEEKLTDDDKNCLIVCENVQNIMKFYVMAVTLQEQPPRYSTVVPDSPVDDDEGLAKVLRLTKDETQRLLTFLTIDNEKNNRPQVKFQQSDDRFSHFLTAFLPNISKTPPLVLSQELTSNDLALIGELLCQCVLYGSSSVGSWKRAAFESCIDPSSLLHAAICYWLKKPLGNNARSELMLFMHLMAALTSLSSQREKVEFWEGVRSVITESTNITNALTAAIITRCVYLNIEDQLADNNESDWETVSSESCEWSQLISQVEAVALLQSTLNFKPTQRLLESSIPCLEYNKPDFSLSYIINKGPGSVCESVAKWVCSWGLKPEWLFVPTGPSSPVQGSETGTVVSGITPGHESSLEARETIPSQDSALDLLAELRKHFPYSLAPGPLVAGQAWEYISAWARDPDQMQLFSVLLTSLSHIASPHLRQGLCSIIWNVHLRTKFEGAVRLLHKVGKLPKEKLCRQDINMSDSNVKHFLKHLSNFLETFIESAFAAESSDEMTKIKVEPLWSECQPSLAEICLAQALPNTSILELQAQCVNALTILVGLPMRLHRPVTTLFDSFSESYLWHDIKDKFTIELSSPDAKLQSSRLSFLTKAISAAVEPLSTTDGSIKDTIHWISQIFSLAKDWDLCVDILRIHQICQFYIHNQDRYAEEVLAAVNDKEKLGNQLLIIVGQRMKTILSDSNIELKERMSNLSPSITTWIQDQEELKVPCSLQDTVQLSELVVTLLPEFTSDNKFAVLLYEAIQPLAR